MPNPPNKTRTQPGLGEGGADAVPRLTSAEMKRVRREAREEAPQPVDQTPPPVGMAERPRLRDSVRREEPDDDETPPAPRAEEVFSRPRLRDSVRRDEPDDAPPAARPPEEVFARARPRLPDSVRREEPSTPPPKVDSLRPRIRDSVRREDPDDTFSGASATPREEQVSLGRSPPSLGPPRRGSALWAPEKDTGTRPKPVTGRSLRPPVTVDEVGATALKIARTTRREGAPKLVASRAIVARAPIDTRAAFVLSLIDGRNTVNAIVDMAGMPDEEVKAILERLARLGLIQLP